MRLVGKLEQAFFGGPVWVLQADDGRQYQLVGEVPEGFDGQRVAVQGREEEEQMGVGMVGPIVRVTHLAAAD